MTAILGISAFYHDSAAALIVDGEIVAAQEERFTRKKHDAGFPTHAIEYCLKQARLSPEHLDYVGFYDKPFLKFERLLETYLAFAPLGFRSFLEAMPVWLRQKLFLPREIQKGLRHAYHRRIVFTDHHESHAASAFFPSPFEEAAILTLDGVGEYATASFGIGCRNRISLSHELRFPHSVGLLYSAFTYYAGFKVNSGEYKLMGLALNCVGNGRILREGPFEKIWIQPAAGDAGGAIGVALFIWHQLLEKPRTARTSDSQHGSLLGPSFSQDQIRQFLDSSGATYHAFGNEQGLLEQVVQLLSQEKVVGWFHGRMEFGPRALGSRSILGDARSPEMQSVMNQKIKFRESFRPFAPSVLEEVASQYFEIRAGEVSPYMLLVAPINGSRRRPSDRNRTDLKGIDLLKIQRSEVPAITHVDYSARIQTVDPLRHGRYYKLLRRFYQTTGCPVIINTSFNVRGEPIVCTPEEAYRCFRATHMDALVLEDFLLLKEEQTIAKGTDAQGYLAQFKLD